MPVELDFVVIGAGPYGLSISALLRKAGAAYKVFGSPMDSWANQMPEGMYLKSEGFASNIYDPDAEFTLKEFCRSKHLPYQDAGLPVALSTFVDYGREFQRLYVPDLVNSFLVRLDRIGEGFRLFFNDHAPVTARRVVIAVGVNYFRFIPEVFARLTSSAVSHSADYGKLEKLCGRRVFVIGSGASAIDLAGLLAQQNADVHLFSRRSALPIHTKGKLQRNVFERIRQPMSGIGPGWRSLFYCEAPGLFRWLPKSVRRDQAERFPGPAGGWFMRGYMDPVHVHLESHLCSAEASLTGKVAVEVIKGNRSTERLECDHIIAATGYRVDINKLPFLTSEIKSQIKQASGAPILTDFQSSVPGLFFVGPVSAYSVGPIARFAVGAKYTIETLARSFGESPAVR